MILASIVRFAVLRGLVLGLALCAPLWLGQPALARGASESFAPLVKRVLPAVVNISVAETTMRGPTLPPELRGTPFERQFRERFGGRQQTMGAGSGFIVDPAGFIVTNRHVVGRADRIKVALADGTEFVARLIGADELTDIALLKVNAPRPLPFVAFGDSRQVEVGDWIIAAGNPFGLGGSVSAGIISARGRDLGAGPFDDFLQLDAPINPGNSGGPLFNMDGQVVGVNTAIVSPSGGSVGIGFAIPSEIVLGVVRDLREKGRIERGWLGVSMQEIQTAGVGIAGVERAGPAARAGLRPGDVVIAVDGIKVDTARELIRVVARKSPGANATLNVRRQGRDVELPVTVGKRPPTSAANGSEE
ncbi:MAG: PDZ domain-containing protein [Acetobacteraceae bacterium]|nr:PDZ domain-containing protein [Acetobacteraceae bacterium]